MGKLDTSSGWFGGSQDLVRRDPAKYPHRVAEQHLAMECDPIGLRTVFPTNRKARLAKIRERWVNARPGRRVIVVQGHNHRFAEQWVAIFVEDDKGVARAHGVTWADALERAISLVGAAIPEDES